MEKITRTSGKIWQAFTRKKHLDVSKMQDTQLKRCLTALDLVALGVGSSLGAGVYVLVGTVTKTLTGPAILVSFLIAAFASFLSGMCYAEFAARVPKAGSAYVYSYVSVGEFWAYVIGWNMILENIIGVAACGKAWSQFVDAMFNDTIKKTLENKVRLSSDDDGWLDSYPDFLALAFLILVSLFSCVGVKLSSRINVVFTVVNLSMIVFIVAVGFSKAQLENWTHSPHGFFPFGFRGVMAGAATCFYSFIGFDAITTSGEEANNPTKHVPIAIVITLVLCLVCFLGVGSVLTLLVPWNTLAQTAALPKAFAQREVYGAEYAIAIGGVCGLTASTLASIYPLPRSIYSMAQDGLLFKWLGLISKKTEVPVSAAILSGFLVSLAALLLDLDSLIEMMSIGTLMAYTMVAISVLVLHYQKESVGLTASDQMYISHCSDLHVSSASDITTAKTSEIMDKKSLNINAPKHRHSINSSLFTPQNTLAHSTRLFSTIDTSRITLSEDTGLLKVGGEGGNKVRYVPTKTTTVIKKIKSRITKEDSENESEEDEEEVVTPAITINLPKTQESLVVEEYRLKQKLQLEQDKIQKQNSQDSIQSSTNQTTSLSVKKSTQPYSLRLHKGSYQPMDNSLTSLQTIALDEPTANSRRKVLISTALLITTWMCFCVLSIHGPELYSIPLSPSSINLPNTSMSSSFRQPGKLYKTVQKETKTTDEITNKDFKNNNMDENYLNKINKLKDTEKLPFGYNESMSNLNNRNVHFQWYMVVIYVLVLLMVLGLGLIISKQPQNHSPLNFTTPFIPLLPILSILINIYLMFNLSDITWIRFIVWLAIGFVIYFSYGIWNSLERRTEDKEIILENEEEYN